MISLLHQHVRATQYVEFIIRLNSKDWDGISTCIILRQIQLRLGFPNCILSLHPSILLPITSISSFSFKLLQAMKDQLFNFITPEPSSSWNIPLDGPTIMQALIMTQDLDTAPSHPTLVTLQNKVINSYITQSLTLFLYHSFNLRDF